MKPTHRMIHALERAAKKIEMPGDGGAYKWHNAAACNCGTLLQELEPGMHNNTFYNRLAYAIGDYIKGGYWSAVDTVFGICREKELEPTCNITGLPEYKLREELAALGFEEGDFEDIEFAGLGILPEWAQISIDVAKGRSPRPGMFNDPVHVAGHMRMRARELRAKRRAKAEERLARMKLRHVPVEVVEEQKQTVAIILR